MSAVADGDFGLSCTYDLPAASTVTCLPAPLSGVVGHYRRAGCTVPPTGKFAYVAYSPVTSPCDANAGITCSDGDVMTRPAGCTCVSGPDSGEMTSPVPITGPTCLHISDQLRHSVDFVEHET